MPRYSDLKKAIIKDGRFLRKHEDEDNELLTRWFWAGVAAAVQVESAMSSNAVLAKVRAELKKFEGKPLSDYALGYRDALKKISEHFS